MLYLSRWLNFNLFGVRDSATNKEEFYHVADIYAMKRKGIDIKGVKVKGWKCWLQPGFYSDGEFIVANDKVFEVVVARLIKNIKPVVLSDNDKKRLLAERESGEGCLFYDLPFYPKEG